MRVGIVFRVGREQNRTRVPERKRSVWWRGVGRIGDRDCSAGISCPMRTRARARSRGGWARYPPRNSLFGPYFCGSYAGTSRREYQGSDKQISGGRARAFHTAFTHAHKLTRTADRANWILRRKISTFVIWRGIRFDFFFLCVTFLCKAFTRVQRYVERLRARENYARISKAS